MENQKRKTLIRFLHLANSSLLHLHPKVFRWNTIQIHELGKVSLSSSKSHGEFFKGRGGWRELNFHNICSLFYLVWTTFDNMWHKTMAQNKKYEVWKQDQPSKFLTWWGKLTHRSYVNWGLSTNETPKMILEHEPKIKTEHHLRLLVTSLAIWNKKYELLKHDHLENITKSIGKKQLDDFLNRSLELFNMTNNLETRFLRQVNQTWVAKELTRGYDGPVNRMHLNKLQKKPKTWTCYYVCFP